MSAHSPQLWPCFRALLLRCLLFNLNEQRESAWQRNGNELGRPDQGQIVLTRQTKNGNTIVHDRHQTIFVV